MSADKKTEKTGQTRTVAVNRRARHDYFIEDTVVAGIVLVGTEVKSLRAGKANLTDAYARIEHGEAWLHHLHIAPHTEGNRHNVEPMRSRKLLLRKAELARLSGLTQQKGLALVPLSLFFVRGFAKVEIGVARGKKLYDKRESIAERDRQREARREFAGRQDRG
jgi:SsrA-binding protein